MSERVWRRIQQHAGETFHKVRGEPFTYAAHNGYVAIDRTPRNIPRADFEEALTRLPLTTTSQLQDLQGPSFVFAILTEQRIRGSDY